MKDPTTDLTGMRFGKWVVLEYAGVRVYYSGGMSNHMWLCRCECGRQKQIQQNNLVRGYSTQCQGCSSRRHGMSSTKLYIKWGTLKKSGQWPKEWLDFAVFRKAVGDPPNSKARLIRSDPTKPHSSENSFWGSLDQLRQIRKKLKEESSVQDAMLMQIRNAEDRDQKIRCMVAARNAGHTYAVIALAAGITAQRVHQIISKRIARVNVKE